MQNAKKGKIKSFNCANLKVGIVQAEFNSDITEALLASAKKKLAEYKVLPKNIRVEKVAGSIEIPLVLQALAKTKKYDCLIAIGAIIKGETPHFNYVAKIATEGVLRVMLDYSIPIGFGVLTANNLKQAQARTDIGEQAVEAALNSLKVIKSIK